MFSIIGFGGGNVVCLTTRSLDYYLKKELAIYKLSFDLIDFRKAQGHQPLQIALLNKWEVQSLYNLSIKSMNIVASLSMNSVTRFN